MHCWSTTTFTIMIVLPLLTTTGFETTLTTTWFCSHLNVLPIVASCDSMWRTVIAFYIYLCQVFLWNKLFSCCHGVTFLYSFVDIWSLGLLWRLWHLFVHSSSRIAFINLLCITLRNLVMNCQHEYDSF